MTNAIKVLLQMQSGFLQLASTLPTRTSLPCNVAVVDLRSFLRFRASKFSVMQD
jgi:hypothetical protein